VLRNSTVLHTSTTQFRLQVCKTAECILLVVLLNSSAETVCRAAHKAVMANELLTLQLHGPALHLQKRTLSSIAGNCYMRYNPSIMLGYCHICIADVMIKQPVCSN
jgi:hypothetical protein